jgi:hypothetical protein
MGRDERAEKLWVRLVSRIYPTYSMRLWTHNKLLLVVAVASIMFFWRLILDISVEADLLDTSTCPTNNVFNALQ